MNIKNISKLGAIILIIILAINSIKNGEVTNLSQEDKAAISQVKEELLYYMEQENTDEFYQ